MKTIIVAIIAILVGFAAGYVILNQSGNDQVAADSSSVRQYTCGMHPEIVTDEPGYCPICGMKLVPRKEGSGQAEGTIVIDPATVHNMGLVTAKAEKMLLNKSVKAFGRIQYSEPLIHTVNVKIPGWIEKLHVNYEGASVRAGEPLFEIYSPELVAAQREYLVARANNDRLMVTAASASSQASQLLDAAAMRLKNWDISADQIQNLAVSGELTKSMLIRSPYTGIVVAKHVDLGDKLDPGMMAYKIADISKVWVSAFIYEQDLPFLKIGQKARVVVPSIPGRDFAAMISYVSSYLDDNQQVEIRLDVPNYDQILKPGMYAEVYISSSLPGDRLAIPSMAVIKSGVKEVVYLALADGSFSPRIISTGAYGENDYVEVVSGLDVGADVVVSGQFLLDSESRLNESLAFTHGHEGHLSGVTMNDDMAKRPGKSDHEMNDGGRASKNPDTLSGIYTCPMPEHFHVLQYGEGKCAECGMKLVPIEETENTDAYFCPMEEDRVVADNPGKCPKCGMNLVKLDAADKKAVESESHSMTGHEPGRMAADEKMSGIYTCPMPEHFHVLQYGEGKCGECGMKLVPVEKTANKDVYYCPMEEDSVVSSKSGECSKCGMNLVKMK